MSLDQKFQECNTQIKYLKHVSLLAFESVTLAQRNSIAAKDSKKESKTELDILKKKVYEYVNKRSSMKESMMALVEAEKHRVKTICQLELKMQCVEASLAEATNVAIDMHKFESQAKNTLLCTLLDNKTQCLARECKKHSHNLMTAKMEAKKWQLQVEENAIEIKMLKLKLATAQKIS